MQKILFRPFEGIARYLYKQSCIHQWKLFSNRKVAEDLMRMHPREKREVLCTEYYVTKLARSLVICSVGGLLVAIAGIRMQYDGESLAVGYMVMLALSAAVYFLSDYDLHKELEKKKECMRRTYPDVVHMLALYLGAGMTIRGAFQKIAGDYDKSVVARKRASPVYEEMRYACRELQAGISEGAVYEHFARRIGVQEYIRLSTLLTQNLKKGNSTLLQRLHEEAEKSTQERLQNGRRLGEEAVTKMLLPMVLMLIVVMLMIMIPAFSSMGM